MLAPSQLTWEPISSLQRALALPVYLCFLLAQAWLEKMVVLRLSQVNQMQEPFQLQAALHPFSLVPLLALFRVKPEAFTESPPRAFLRPWPQAEA